MSLHGGFRLCTRVYWPSNAPELDFARNSAHHAYAREASIVEARSEGIRCVSVCWQSRVLKTGGRIEIAQGEADGAGGGDGHEKERGGKDHQNR